MESLRISGDSKTPLLRAPIFTRMESKTVIIPNISCGHCKKRVEKTMNGVEGVSSAEVTVDAKSLTIAWDESKVSWGDLQGALDKAGYPPEG